MKNFILFSAAIMALFILFSCGPAVPTKEIEDAKTALERAKSVDAPVYAAQDFMQAQDDLNQANSFVDDKKNKEALDKAVSSKKEADKSFDNARTARAEDIFQKCGELLTTADQNFADKLEPAKYNDATNDFEKLKVLYGKNDYDSIYSNGTLLYPKVKELADNSTAVVAKAKDAVAGAQDRYDEASGKEIVQQYAMDDLKTAEPVLDDARTSLAQGSLDDAVKKAGDAVAIIDAALKKAEAAYRSTVKMETNATGTIDIDRQKELDKEKKEAKDAISDAKKKLEQIKSRMKGSFLGSSLFNFTFVELPYMSFGDEMNSNAETSTNTGQENTTNAVNMTNIVTPPENGTNTMSTVKDEDITEAMVEKYIKMAQDAYDKQEYLDSIDYAKEASRMADILLAREQFQIYTVKLRPGNRDCLWKISGYMYDNQYPLWPIIWRANKYQILDPDLIYPGQELKIPPLP